jgi:hypothetical protein
MCAVVDVAGIEDGAKDVLDAVRYTIDAGIGNRRMSGPDERDVLIGLVTAFIDIPKEFIRLKRSGVDIGFVFVANLEEFVIKGGRFPFSDEVIYVLALEFFERRSKRGFAAGGKMDTRYSIVHPVSKIFTGLKGMIPDAAAKFTAGLLRLER